MKRVFCVDDDPGLQSVLQLIFVRAGYETIICADGISIMNSQAGVPDIYILDKQLSGASGLDICRFLKSQDLTREIPVIMISASPSLAMESIAAGADAYLEKPFRLKDILELVAKYTSDSLSQNNNQQRHMAG